MLISKLYLISSSGLSSELTCNYPFSPAHPTGGPHVTCPDCFPSNHSSFRVSHLNKWHHQPPPRYLTEYLELSLIPPFLSVSNLIFLFCLQSISVIFLFLFFHMNSSTHHSMQVHDNSVLLLSTHTRSVFTQCSERSGWSWCICFRKLNSRWKWPTLHSGSVTDWDSSDMDLF